MKRHEWQKVKTLVGKYFVWPKVPFFATTSAGVEWRTSKLIENGLLPIDFNSFPTVHEVKSYQFSFGIKFVKIELIEKKMFQRNGI